MAGDAARDAVADGVGWGGFNDYGRGHGSERCRLGQFRAALAATLTTVEVVDGRRQQ